jgi:hypothetical protein
VDQAITGLMIILSFSLAHERALELARSFMERVPTTMLRLRRVVDWLTRGPGAVLPACALALATGASLLDAFRRDDGQVVFFQTYLSVWAWTPIGVVGYLLMGLAISFGSQFWHDLAKGLIDVRARLQDTRDAALPPPPVTPQRALLQDQA